ncbi:plasma-membrane choline transporter-domain-containing protein [Gamsiella multidivaricata]|uniref:plasma-membrane choline transporter-domain-containing protein n=1 Tax=Gamsiella multidivaricata TaxID=101098 RepID=UPI0022211E65|nr:plasma-membrane choline transporter-domain-containing protein [Gamsiella multidivaricata]KAI7830664.1 plasma-membrane choline transporter-domain-containing protein [Gamsiella multidivaricata]
MSSHRTNAPPRMQGLQGAVGRNWRSVSRNDRQAPGNMAGTLFYSVPTIDNEPDDSDGDRPGEDLPLHESYMPDYDSEDDESDSSTQSPPMSLFLDRHPQPEAPPLTPAAIYLDVPPPVPSSKSKSKASGTLGEQLLEPSAIPTGPVGWTSISYKRNFKDPFFAALYVFALAVYLILGIVLIFTTSSSSLEGQIYNVFSVMKSSAGMLTFVVLVSAALGTLWLVTLRSFTRPVVWATVLSVPCFAFGIFIWSMVSSFQGPRRDNGGRDPQDTGLTVLSLLPLGIGSLFLSVIYIRRQYIARTTAIIELACEILKDNPDMFYVSFGLMAVHVVFTAIWLLFFSRVFLIGHVESSVGAKKWVLEDNFYPIAIYFIFIYLWTSAVLGNVQRVTLANVVSKWYFHRHEPFAYHSSKITEPALINATTTSFGSVCLGGLFIAVLQTTTFLLKNLAKRLNDSTFPLFVFVVTCCRVVQGLVESFNNYALIYVGITGESLFAAARSASKIFHRNLLWGLLSDFLTKLILYVYSTLLSILTGFAAFVFATHGLKSPYGYVIGILAGIIPYYVNGFFTHIMSITIDATFLCYAIDLDTNTCHCNKAHSAFGGSH